jgi:hypothetical protein
MLVEFKANIDNLCAKFPDFKDEILDAYQLALDEIEGGGSISHEIELCLSDIDQILND